MRKRKAEKNRSAAAGGLWAGFQGFLLSERGDIVSALGWMAIMALVLVAVKGIVDTGVTSYADRIFDQLDLVFSTPS